MRVAFLSMQQAFLSSLGRQQGSIARLQEQVATGRRFTRPGQDPVAATQALNLDAVLARNDQFLRNTQLATNRLALEEDTLARMGDLLQRVRELTVQAANGPLPAADRALVAVEVRELRAQLVALGNTQDGAGGYLFAGNMTGTVPFVESGGAVAYAGDQGQRLVQIGTDRFVADGDHGAGLLLQVPASAGVRSVFATLDGLLATLAAPAATPAETAALAGEFGTALTDLDLALDHLLAARTGVGTRLATIEAQQDALASTALDLQQTLSGLRDTDYAAALTRLEQELLSLEAAQKSFVRAAGLSLFDYL